MPLPFERIREMNEKYDVILDSGAFSAWTKQIEIDVDQYCDFALEYLGVFEVVVNLDIIPGRPGKKDSSFTTLEAAATVGWQNYEHLLKRGIPKEKLVHVFHQNEGFHWLQRMVDEGLPYIGLSPANDRNPASKKAWLHRCMKYVTDENGMPLNKWHGFAVTSFDLMTSFPWYSVDSASARMVGAYGGIWVPEKPWNSHWGKNNKLERVFVSSNHVKSQMSGEHFTHLPPERQEQVYAHVAKHGWDFEELVSDGKERGAFNMYILSIFQTMFPPWPWPYSARKANLGLMSS